MPKKRKTGYLGTTKKIKSVKDSCLLTFTYTAIKATDSKPFIIVTGPRWKAKKGGTYISGVNLNFLNPRTSRMLVSKFGALPPGGVSYTDIKKATKSDPACCIRTYNVRNIRALHTVDPSGALIDTLLNL